VDIKTTPFLANIFRRLVAISLKRGAVPIGGMATALPNPDPRSTAPRPRRSAPTSSGRPSRASIRGWVAHIFHMKTAGDPFKALIGSGWKPTAQMANPDNYPVVHQGARGPDHRRRHTAQRTDAGRVRRGARGRAPRASVRCAVCRRR